MSHAVIDRNRIEQGRVATSLAGIGEIALSDLVDRTVRVAESLAG